MSLRIRNIYTAKIRAGGAVVAVLAVFLVLTSTALAAEDFTWSGGGDAASRVAASSRLKIVIGCSPAAISRVSVLLPT